MLFRDERALVQQRNAPARVRPLVERTEEGVPRRLVAVAGRMNRVEGDDVAVVCVRQQRAGVLPDEIGAERHVAAESVLREILVGEGDVVVQVLHPVGARERPEREGIPARLRRLGVVDHLVRVEEREAAGRAQELVEPELDAGSEIFHGILQFRRQRGLPDRPPGEGAEKAPAEAPRFGKDVVFQLSRTIAGLDDQLVAHRPADHALVRRDDLRDVILGDRGHVEHLVVELDDLQRLDLEGDLVDDAGQAVAGADQRQQLGVLLLGRFLERARWAHPLDAGHERVDLPEPDAVEGILRVAARRRPERHVADLDVQDELQLQLPQRVGGLNHLQPGLRGERHLLRVDPHNLVQRLHVDDGAGRRHAGRQRVIAAHRPNRTRELVPLFEDVLELFDAFRANELLRAAADAAIVVGDGRAHRRQAPG